MDLVQGKGVIDQKNLDISIFKPATFSAIKKTKVPTQRKLKQGHFQEIPGLFSVLVFNWNLPAVPVPNNTLP